MPFASEHGWRSGSNPNECIFLWQFGHGQQRATQPELQVFREHEEGPLVLAA